MSNLKERERERNTTTRCVLTTCMNFWPTELGPVWFNISKMEWNET